MNISVAIVEDNHDIRNALEQIIDMADELMYEVKNSTKNNVRFTTWDGKNFRHNGN